MEEQRYKEKIKGKRFESEERTFEQKRLQQIKSSIKFKSQLANLGQQKVLSERQFKHRFNALDVKFTKEYMKEQKVEQEMFDREKLKVK